MKPGLPGPRRAPSGGEGPVEGVEVNNKMKNKQQACYRIELVRTRIAEPSEELSGPAAVARFCGDLPSLDREHLVRLDLDCRCQVIGRETVHIGTADSVVLSPREIFRGALLSGATQVVVVHNHPSGSPEPSGEDRVVQKRLRKAGEMLEIELTDFVILGEGGRYWSAVDGYGRLPPETPGQHRLERFARA